MNTLALSDEILLTIDKPARYIGNELNMVKKNPKDVDIRFAMCFPDVYEIGMSHLGIQILYDMFNKRDDVYCERVYSPWPDLHKIMKEKNIPLFALESQEPIKDFDFLGITIQYEMCYTNILQILDLSQIAMLSSERKEDDPIVIGVPTIRSRLQISLICSISEKAKFLIRNYLRCISSAGKKRSAERNSYAVQRLFLESMCLPCMRWLIKKMERLHLLHQNMRMCRQR